MKTDLVSVDFENAHQGGDLENGDFENEGLCCVNGQNGARAQCCHRKKGVAFKQLQLSSEKGTLYCYTCTLHCTGQFWNVSLSALCLVSLPLTVKWTVAHL